MPSFRLCAASVIGLILLAVSVSVRADVYRLGPEDQIRVRIVEWTLENVQSPIDGTFVVGPEGQISLPFIGDIEAAGHSTMALATEISQGLKTKLALKKPPVTSVQIIHFRPFYVTGDVTSPGAYEYRPGMTILKAVALAGGLRRSQASTLDLLRAMLDARTEIKAAQDNIQPLMLRQTRLQAELAGAEKVDFSQIDSPSASGKQDTGTDGAGANAIEAERQLFNGHRNNFQQAIAKQKEESALLQTEAQHLSKNRDFLANEATAINGQLQRMNDFEKRGLSVRFSSLDLESRLASVRGSQEDLDARSVEIARQQLAANDSVKSLADRRRLELIRELQKTQAELQTEHRKENANKTLLTFLQQETSQTIQPVYTIIHDDTKQSKDVVTSTATVLQAGDVLEVRLKKSEMTISNKPSAMKPSASQASESNNDKSTQKRPQDEAEISPQHGQKQPLRAR